MPENEEWPDWWPHTRREEYPYWWVWQGVSGLYYARRIMSSPPKVVRGESVDALRDAIDYMVRNARKPMAFDRA